MEEVKYNPSKILIVDDNVSFHLLYGEYLRLENCIIDYATDGFMALEKANKGDIDLILLDIMMPNMDGFETCKRLKDNNNTKNIPVIFITAIEDKESFAKGFELGAIDFLTKPINSLDLKLKIRNYIKLAQNETKIRQSELRYKSIVEDQTEFILRFLPNGTITFVNNALCKFLQNTREDLLGSDYNEKVFLQLNKSQQSFFDGLSIEQPIISIQKETILPDGELSFQEWVIRALYDSNGVVSEYQGVGRDITMQIIYEKAIRALTDETAGVTGEIFFNTLVKNILKILNAEYSVLAEYNPDDPKSLLSFAACKKGEIIDNIELRIRNKALLDHIRDEVIVNKGQDFLKVDSNFIVDGKKMKYFASIPLMSKKKIPTGLLMIFLKNSMTIPEPILDLIKIFAVRASVEQERLSSEAKIIESETKYRILADYNYEWEYWIGKDGKYIYVSPSCYRITGYKAEEFMANSELLYDITFPEFRQILREQASNSLNEDLFHNSIEIKITDKSGSERWINHTCNLLYDEIGNYRGIRGNIMDVTNKKHMEMALVESEKKFKNIFHSSKDGIVISGKEKTVLEINLSFLDIIGIKREEIKNQKLTKIIHNRDVKKFTFWIDGLDSKGSTLEIDLETSSGIKSIEISGKEIQYESEMAVLSIFRDVTERKEVQAKILNTIITTEEKERTRYAQDLHDDLGPLLSTIKLYTNSILSARNNENKEIAIEKSIETIDEAISSLKEIANNLSPHILRDFGLGVAIDSIVTRFNDTNKVYIYLKSNLKKRFKSNYEASLYRIIIELINNTIKHSKAYNVSIELKMNKDNLNISYTDYGIGCDLEQVLQNAKGSGLFNMINRIRSINGEINIESKEGQGFKTQISISNIF